MRGRNREIARAFVRGLTSPPDPRGFRGDFSWNQSPAKFVMGRVEEYRRYTRQCLEIAPTFQDEEARATLLDLARAWLRLAHLAQANRYIADLAVQIVRQREIVKHALDTGRRSEMAESLLDALEGSLRAHPPTFRWAAMVVRVPAGSSWESLARGGADDTIRDSPAKKDSR